MLLQRTRTGFPFMGRILCSNTIVAPQHCLGATRSFGKFSHNNGKTGKIAPAKGDAKVTSDVNVEELVLGGALPEDALRENDIVDIAPTHAEATTEEHISNPMDDPIWHRKYCVFGCYLMPAR